MPKVFLSYRRGETTASAGRLCDKLALTFGKEKLFFDVDTIEPGLDFVAVLEEKVGSCDVLVALIGKDWRVERLARRPNSAGQGSAGGAGSPGAAPGARS